MSPVVTVLWAGFVTLLWVGVVAGVWVIVSAGDGHRPDASGVVPEE